MNAILVGVGLSAFGILTGLAWRWPAVASTDQGLFARLNYGDNKPVLDRILWFLRPLGTSWALIAIALLVALWDWRAAVSLLAVAGVSGALERAIKVGVNRPRPFEAIAGVRVRQVPPPEDPSFPSGDTSRAWFLASSLTFGSPIPLALAWLSFVLALTVGFGRIRAGVHYPTDVWSGAWLGMGLGLAWAGLFPLLAAGLS